jgi:hypothetical protein
LNIQHSALAARRGEQLAIVAVWAAAIAFINPRGNFPIDDDWDFALATWRYAETGHFHFTAFTAASLRAQVLWGALWTRLFGESFDVLRLSTLVLGAATLVVVYRMLRRADVPRFGCVVAVLALGFHPIFLWSSCTFMTEVPFLFASAVALACFIRGFDDDRVAWVLAGCAAAMTACFVRQTGITLLAAPMLLAMVRRRWRDAAVIGGTIALFGAIYLVNPEWLTGSPAEFAVHFRMWTESTFRLPEQIAVFDHYATFNAQNCALFFLPLVVPLALVFVDNRRRIDFVIAALLAVVLFVRVQSLVAAGLPMPYFVSPYCCDVFAGNIFADFGLGPLALPGLFPFRLPYAARLAITYGSVLLAVCLLWAVLRRAATTNASILALGAALFGSLALFGSGLYVDRYSLDSAWPLVIALPLMLPWQSRTVRGAALPRSSSLPRSRRSRYRSTSRGIAPAGRRSTICGRTASPSRRSTPARSRFTFTSCRKAINGCDGYTSSVFLTARTRWLSSHSPASASLRAIPIAAGSVCTGARSLCSSHAGSLRCRSDEAGGAALGN